ncbi:uncharacterized protein LOC134287817 [Aedes albopictus]|uniref:Protein with signal anchor n=1 Tax=Aedes albopictus TaxID=7160 RepID=A0ABM1Z7Q6_AEDAL
MSEMMNTVQFRFPPGNFVKQLDTDLLLMEAAYKTARDRSLFIKFVSPDAMKQSLEKNVEPRAFVYTSGKSVDVRMLPAGVDMRYVGVFDLPPEITDESLATVLQEFGKIERVVREKFPAELGLDHLSTGVRGIHSSIDVLGWKGNVFYDGLRDTCFLCHALGYRKDSCPQKKSRNVEEKKKGNTPSYAGIVAGTEIEPVVEQESVESSGDEIIEVLEESFDHPTEATGSGETPAGCDQVDHTDRNKQQKKSVPTLEEVGQAILEALGGPQAKQRRAQYAASGSGSSSGSGSGSGRAPRKKCARQMFY